MSYRGSWKIDDLLTFYATTHDPSTGAVTDADSVPTYRVYEDETATPILTGSMALLDDANTVGFYSEQITLSAANGLEKGKSYTIRISATVGGVTGTIEQPFQIEAEVDITQSAIDAVWDELITGSLHNISTSAGKRLRNASSIVIIDGTCPSAPLLSNQIVLNGDASAEDGAYDPAMISIVAGTGIGQTRLILEYEGSTKTATLDRNWKIDPDDTSEYRIASHPGREHVNEGLAQDGDTNTITLNTLASDSNDAYCGQIIFIRSGTGEDQARKVLTYNGTSKIATVDKDWHVVPDDTTGYVMLPTGSFDTPTLVSSIFAFVVEGAFTVKGMLRIMFAVLSGKSTGSGTTTQAYRSVADDKDRVSGTVSQGNRTAVTRDQDD